MLLPADRGETCRYGWHVPSGTKQSKPSEGPMLHYAVVFFVIAIIAAVLGFGGVAAGAAGIAKILFFVFLIAAVIALLTGRRSV